MLKSASEEPIERCSVLPEPRFAELGPVLAQRLEQVVPAMRAKGRVQVGADADLTVFDAARVVDRATYERPAQFSDGIVHVLVNGTFVVRNEASLGGVNPGRAIRRGQ